ncbi:MAG: DUF192 domain-containing protein [Acidobacteriota bacterium]
MSTVREAAPQTPRPGRHAGGLRYPALLIAALEIAVAACAASPGGGGEPGAVGTAGREGASRGGFSAPSEIGARRAEVRFPGGRVLVVEIADTPSRRARGYMFRKEIAADEGMIFVFPAPGFHTFYMKNTLVALDIIWMDEDFTVIHVESSVPPCEADPCPTYAPPRKARYVLEVKGGTARREGLAPGDRLGVVFPYSPSRGIGAASRNRRPGRIRNIALDLPAGSP